MIRTSSCALRALTFTFALFTANMTSAATYYVAKTGSDSHTCSQAQSPSTPKLTAAAGVRCLAAGDTLYIKTGTYFEGLQTIELPSGSSWSNPVTIARYGTDPVVFAQNPFRTFNTTSRYVVFDGFIFDCQGCERISRGDGTFTGHGGIAIGQGAGPYKFINFVIRNATGNGATVGTNGNQFVNCKVHDIGSSSYDHGFYVTGSDNLIERCEIYNVKGAGIKFGQDANSQANIARANVIHNFGIDGGGGWGIGFASGSVNSEAYNNIIYNCAAPSGSDNAGIFDYAGRNSKIYNNTVYNMGPNCSGILTFVYAEDAVISYNIVVGGRPNMVDNGRRTVFRNNFCDVSGTGCALVGDPKFMNPGAVDFRLQTGSLATDFGANTGTITVAHPPTAPVNLRIVP